MTSKPGRCRCPGTSLGDTCLPTQTASGLRGGVKLQQVLAWNVGTLSVMQRKNAKWLTHEAPSTNAQARGGLARSSEEGR
jgi:hypothetical protein